MLKMAFTIAKRVKKGRPPLGESGERDVSFGNVALRPSQLVSYSLLVVARTKYAVLLVFALKRWFCSN